MIQYVRGDAVKPQGSGNKIIAHVCNNIGAWGRGFVLSVTQEHPGAEAAYQAWYQEREPWDRKPFILGEVQLVQTKPDVWVANMIGQHGIMKKEGQPPPIRYEALRSCLQEVAIEAKRLGATVHMPRIGCGLAGGEWSKVEEIVIETLCSRSVSVTVYDFESKDSRTIPWRE